ARLGEPGEDSVDSDLRRQGTRQPYGEGVERSFGTGVGVGGSDAHAPGDRGDVDHSAAYRPERRLAGPHHLVGADQVDRVGPVEVFRRERVEVAHRDEAGGPRVVDQTVDPSPAFERGSGKPAAIGVVRNVGTDY